MVSPTDVQFIKTRFNVQSATGQDYWNWTTIPKSGGGNRVEFDAATQTYKISYSFTTQDSDLTYFNDPIAAITDGFAPYLLHRENADPALIATINGILNPTGAYSVLFTDVSKIDFVAPAAGTRGLIDISSADNDTTDPNNLPPTGLAATYVDRTLPSATGYNAEKHGDIFLSHEYQTGASVGTQKYINLVHEIGHALGLKHPQIQSSTDGPEGPYTTDYNSVKYTMMSYQPHPDMAANVFPTGLQLLDIAAIQSIYGRNYSMRGQNDTTYKINQGFAAANQEFIYTIWDGNGERDTIDARGYSQPVEIDLRQGHFSSIGQSGNSGTGGGTGAVDFDTFDANGHLIDDKGNVAIAFHSIIEHAIGTNIASSGASSKADVLIGNDWKNALGGLDGNDWLFGDGVVYDGEHGFNSVTSDDPTDTSDSFGNLHDPNRTLPGLLNTDTDDDLLVPGQGKDQAFGGVGNDTFMADSDAAGNDLEGDYYHGGGYTGGGFDANRVAANLICQRKNNRPKRNKSRPFTSSRPSRRMAIKN